MNLGSGLIQFAAQASTPSLWMPAQGQPLAAHVDQLFYFIYYLCVFFFTVIVATMVYFVVKYRRKSPNQRTSPVKGSHKLELIWSVIPAVLLIVIFAWGFRDWMRLIVPPANAMEIRVTAKKWAWDFAYPRDGISGANLVVPANTAIKLVMSSQDVIHSFYIPDMRIKRDVLPNRYTVTWFEAGEPGEHLIFCTEYCGTSHSEMISRVRVLPENEYREWVANGGDLGGAGVPLAELGKLVYEQKGCASCHTIDGSPKVGPTFKGLYGATREMENGQSVTADDNYIRESIMAPAAKVLKGYAPVMPSFQGQLNDKQTDALIEYIKTLK